MIALQVVEAAEEKQPGRVPRSGFLLLGEDNASLPLSVGNQIRLLRR